MMTQSKPCKSNWTISIYSHYQTLCLIKNQTKRKVIRPNNNKHLLVNWTHDQTKSQNTHTHNDTVLTNEWKVSTFDYCTFNLTQNDRSWPNPLYTHTIPPVLIFCLLITCYNKEATEESTHTHTENEIQALYLPSTLLMQTPSTHAHVYHLLYVYALHHIAND